MYMWVVPKVFSLITIPRASIGAVEDSVGAMGDSDGLFTDSFESA